MNSQRLQKYFQEQGRKWQGGQGQQFVNILHPFLPLNYNELAII